eukprot:SAG31_NODE_4344_length_3330_cov_1.716496_7_plen_108_part_00
MELDLVLSHNRRAFHYAATRLQRVLLFFEKRNIRLLGYNSTFILLFPIGHVPLPPFYFYQVLPAKSTVGTQCSIRCCDTSRNLAYHGNICHAHHHPNQTGYSGRHRL